MPTLFLTGATGYIGGAILSLLLQPTSPKYDISVLVRGTERSAKLKSMGVTPIVGGNDDMELLERLAESSDVVIHTADSSDHMPSCLALLKGLERRGQRTGVAPLYLHTSGTGVLADKSRGAALSSHIYSDDDQPGIDSLADSQPHRLVDIAVKKAGQRGLVRCHIIIPPIIYGISSGPFKRDTFFLAPSINSALDSSKAGYISTGLPAWNSVHVSDLAELYLLLLKNPGNETWGGYYFAETGEVSFKRIAESIAAAVEQLQGRKVDVGSWNVEEAKKATRGVGGQFIWGSNARCKAVRAYKMGWKPRYTAKDDFEKAMVDQVRLIMDERKAKL